MKDENFLFVYLKKLLQWLNEYILYFQVRESEYYFISVIYYLFVIVDIYMYFFFLDNFVKLKFVRVIIKIELN